MDIMNLHNETFANIHLSREYGDEQKILHSSQNDLTRLFLDCDRMPFLQIFAQQLEEINEVFVYFGCN